MPPQPSGDAVVEPADKHTPEAASGQSSGAYMWAPTEMTKPLEIPTSGPVIAGPAQPKPPIPLPPKPPPKTKADPPSLTPQERVQLLEKQAVVADQRIQALQVQIHHLISLHTGLEGRIRQLETPSKNPWDGLE